LKAISYHQATMQQVTGHEKYVVGVLMC